MTRLPLDDPEYFWSRVEESLTIMEGFKDRDTRRMMLGVAKTYIDLAQRAEERGKAVDALSEHIRNVTPLR